MKLFIIAIAMLLCGSAYAAESTLIGGNLPIQGFAPNGSLTRTLTVYSTTVEMSQYLGYSLWVPSVTTCVVRSMPASSSTKATYIQSPVAATSWYTRIKNPVTPFVNFSGCTSATLEIH